MKTALVIIDMQPEFIETADKVTNDVIKEVRLAKARNAPIVIVEYVNWVGERVYGRTFPEIMAAIGDYKQVSHVRKKRDGGGLEVARTMNRRGYDKKVRLVGVNRTYCVGDTAIGLKDRGFHVTVSRHATNCHDLSDGNYKLKRNGIKLCK